MSTARVPRIPDSTAPHEVTGPLSVVSCSRLGRQANPPRLSLADWLLPSRRR
ncbi:hypothetical protein [Mycolicibacterium litorale]|uniref:hypothetical protein n=1 Tax=Mycolicibacterium litorale TaxID=758802 RepID=UPI0016239D45|nr:hypothetical protein [Mycolicibacterium litorale]